jgi:hypothetical protein
MEKDETKKGDDCLSLSKADGEKSHHRQILISFLSPGNGIFTLPPVDNDDEVRSEQEKRSAQCTPTLISKKSHPQL